MKLLTFIVCLVRLSLSEKPVQSSAATRTRATDDLYGARNATSVEEKGFPSPPAITQSVRRVVRRLGRIIGMPIDALQATDKVTCTWSKSNLETYNKNKKIFTTTNLGCFSETYMSDGATMPLIQRLQEGLKYGNTSNKANFKKWNKDLIWKNCEGSKVRKPDYWREELCGLKRKATPETKQYLKEVFCYACIKNEHNTCGKTDANADEANSVGLVNCIFESDKDEKKERKWI